MVGYWGKDCFPLGTSRGILSPLSRRRGDGIANLGRLFSEGGAPARGQPPPSCSNIRPPLPEKTETPSPNRAAPSSERAALPVWAVRLSISFAAIQGATVTSPAERLPSPSAISAR